jgi:hypothetical protein
MYVSTYKGRVATHWGVHCAKETIMWGYDDHDLQHIAEARGGIRAADSLPDLGADGGRVNRSAQLGGRDAYIARLEHMMDGFLDDSLGNSLDYGYDSSDDSSLGGRDLWIRRMCEARI